MATVLSFLVGLLVGALITYMAMYKRKKTDGIAAYTEQRSNEKQKRKERIMALMKEKEAITNNDVERLLSISDATATNYLQELEQEGLIEQIGTHGRFVRYQRAKAAIA